MNKHTDRYALKKYRAPLVAALGFFTVALWSPLSQAHTSKTSDAWITTKAKLALITANHIGDNEVHVDTNCGRVTLYGKATSQAQKDNAGSIAKGIAGAKSVRNLLQIVPASSQSAVSRDDAAIKSDVEKAITLAGLEGSKISVKSVDNGVVLLAGKAANLSDMLYAEESTVMVPGVRRVATEMTSPNEVANLDMGKIPGEARHQARDAWITTDAKMRLMADGDVPALDISVDTRDGVVTLFGSVPTAAARAAAVADARKVDAAVKVNDELEVISDGQRAQLSADDGVVKSEVERSFKGKPEYKHVDVAVQNGVVHLTGTVSSGWARLGAAVSARSASGVRSVQDDLHLAGAGS